HHSVATMFRDAAPRLDDVRSLREELSAGDTGLLSSERFSRLDRAQFARFRDHFPEYEIRAVAYLRVRSEVLVSRWGESIKHGMDWSFPEYLGKILVAPYESPIINQRLLLDVVSDVFGRDHLDVLIYRPGNGPLRRVRPNDPRGGGRDRRITRGERRRQSLAARARHGMSPLAPRDGPSARTAGSGRRHGSRLELSRGSSAPRCARPDETRVRGEGRRHRHLPNRPYVSPPGRGAQGVLR